MNRMWWIPIVGVLVASCSGGDSGQEPKAAAKTPADAQAPAETVFDPMVGTIDRAKSVDAVAADRMNELNKQLGESE
jgi:hypothetical protein